MRVTHDILDGAATGGQNTSIGISYAPWAGTELSLGSDMITSDSGRRIGATIGLDQQIQLSDKWSASAGVTNRRILNATGTIEQIAPDAAVSSLETNEAYTAAYMALVTARKKPVRRFASKPAKLGASIHTPLALPPRASCLKCSHSRCATGQLRRE